MSSELIKHITDASFDADVIQSGQPVRFTLGSVICPDVEDVVNHMTGEVELTGHVVFLSDYGQEKDHFAIVDFDLMCGACIIEGRFANKAIFDLTADGLSPPD